MLELKLPRLLAAAKEFNVGQDTIVDFLVGKGFSRDDLKPTAKLSEDMYRSLQHQFQGDKVAKNKADLVEIPKGVQQEARKKRDEEEITFNKKDFQRLAQQQPVQEPAAGIPAETKIPEQVAEPAPQIHEVQQPQAQAPAEPEQDEQVQTDLKVQGENVQELAQSSEVNEDTVVHAPHPVTLEATPTTPVKTVEENREDKPDDQVQYEENEPVSLKIEAPEIEGPKIISKIDLSAIDSSTRPKKGLKKPSEPKRFIPEPNGKGQPGKEPARQTQLAPRCHATSRTKSASGCTATVSSCS
ncbi:MAG: hypothetical protein WKG06_45485 [Segetibacter sp.]